MHGEGGALRVQALRDAIAAGNVHRAVEHLAAVRLDAVCCGIGAVDANEMQPVT